MGKTILDTDAIVVKENPDVAGARTVFRNHRDLKAFGRFWRAARIR
jgi:hypothetical protein